MNKKAKVADALELTIKRGGVIPSTQDIAEKFSVSYKTAYGAVTELVNRKMAYRIPGKGAFPIQPEDPERQVKTVGVIWGQSQDLEKAKTSIMTKELLMGINAAAASKNLNIRHFFMDKLSVDEFKEPDYLIFVPGTLKTERTILLREKLECPHLYVGVWHPPEEFCNSVCVDSAAALKDALKYLTGRGFRNIGFLHHDRNNRVYRDLIFRDVKEMLGMPHKPEWEIYTGTSTDFPAAMANGYRLGEKIEKDFPELDTLVCVSDHVAAGVYKRSCEAGTGLAVMGMDNIEGFGYFPLGEPVLTCIAPDYHKVGKSALERLLEITTEPDQRSVSYLKPELTVRKSCGEA